MREMGKKEGETRNNLVITNLKRKNTKFLTNYFAYFSSHCNKIV